MILPIRKMGDPCLLKRSDEVDPREFNTPQLQELIQDLIDTKEYLGGIGIAAPQIGINKRIVIIEFYQENITRYNNVGDCPLKVIINPEITLLEGSESTYNEGCLSVPGLKGEVTRPVGIKYTYHDQYGNLHSGESHEMFSRVMQHECDHLDGILYPMRMKDISKLAFVDV